MGRRVPENLPLTDAAVQYLTWALEELEQLDHPSAAHHVRVALDDLRAHKHQSELLKLADVRPDLVAKTRLS
ncbi:hypothetical protein JQ617_12980 [Bradyrhizobium sp. KB893862 SZCCT0404]|uniref:hypothetical protein n=1 Tax=Bradyrhizobium sp. KB893862 SZCCT0404 TaxID=2807672 RepID=UPI001BA46C14|nr:hypothetical protein [Bradyrhizobium sp. KB893862 SZCCT0404]MBR1174876.1 hypothetical protein [Bradyrhizobium sp. KB893862 SZCCT0404]